MADFEAVGCALGMANGVVNIACLWTEVGLVFNSLISVKIIVFNSILDYISQFGRRKINFCPRQFCFDRTGRGSSYTVFRNSNSGIEFG